MILVGTSFPHYEPHNHSLRRFREGAQIVSSPDFEIIREGDTHSLYIPEVFYEDSGKFSVKVSAALHTITSNFFSKNDSH